MNAQARIKSVDLVFRPVDSPDAEYAILRQRGVAVYFNRCLLVLDEPTNALFVREIDRLLQHIVTLEGADVSCAVAIRNIQNAYQVSGHIVVMGHESKIMGVGKDDTTLEHIDDVILRH